MTKILVANRGEIACRILRTLRDMGHASVAVASEADLDSPHLDEADEVVDIGPADPRQSYLNIHAILAAASKSGANALHPGYGFLSTNAEFAAACERAKLIFIGPTSAAMTALGDKRGARATAERFGIPVLPGDIIIGDSDGVVVIPREQAIAVAEAAEAVFDDETTRRAAIIADRH